MLLILVTMLHAQCYTFLSQCYIHNVTHSCHNVTFTMWHIIISQHMVCFAWMILILRTVFMTSQGHSFLFIFLFFCQNYIPTVFICLHQFDLWNFLRFFIIPVSLSLDSFWFGYFLSPFCFNDFAKLIAFYPWYVIQ